MSNPLMKFKGKYRLLCPIDATTNDFPRDWKPKSTGNIDEVYCDNDIYISCQKNGQIFFKDRNCLMFYCPSKGRLKNLVNKIREELPDVEVKEHYSDVEGWFYFKKDDIELLENILEIRTNGAKRSPFSAKNLPSSDYSIPEEDMSKYKQLTDKLGEQLNDKFEIARLIKNINNNFISDKFGDCKKEMRKLGLKTKEYIHYKGLWDEYLNRIKQEF